MVTVLKASKAFFQFDFPQNSHLRPAYDRQGRAQSQFFAVIEFSGCLCLFWGGASGPELPCRSSFGMADVQPPH
jgi:hypothetical protein